MTNTTVVAAAIALGFSLPAFADSAFNVADRVCGAWLASGPITKCSYGYDRGHYHIDATVNLDEKINELHRAPKGGLINIVTSRFTQPTREVRIATYE
jgi:hypothetical protein